MRISTKVIIHIPSGRVLRREGYDYTGPLALCKASDAQTQLEQSQSDFYKTLSSAYATQFAGQQQILSSLTSAFQPLLSLGGQIAQTFQPILAAGPGQAGFTPTEEAAMRTSASDANANAFQSAQIAAQNSNQSGGSELLPSGAAAQINADVNARAASQEATAQNQITQANYAIGRQNFSQAANILGGLNTQATNTLTDTSKIFDPLGFAKTATQTGTDAFGQATTIQQENSAWEGEVGGALGGIAGSFLGGFGKTLGKNQ